MKSKGLTKDEASLQRSVERGEWRSVKPSARSLARFEAYAAETIRKDRRINIRISQRDLEALQKRALHEGLPYQTLIASILHKFAAGRLGEKP
jgi:predicted DNA binding CopG/RHH family protein